MRFRRDVSLALTLHRARSSPPVAPKRAHDLPDGALGAPPSLYQPFACKGALVRAIPLALTCCPSTMQAGAGVASLRGGAGAFSQAAPKGLCRSVLDRTFSLRQYQVQRVRTEARERVMRMDHSSSGDFGTMTTAILASTNAANLRRHSRSSAFPASSVQSRYQAARVFSRSISRRGSPCPAAKPHIVALQGRVSCDGSNHATVTLGTVGLSS